MSHNGLVDYGSVNLSQTLFIKQSGMGTRCHEEMNGRNLSANSQVMQWKNAMAALAHSA
jgi:hypothetical protein